MNKQTIFLQSTQYLTEEDRKKLSKEISDQIAENQVVILDSGINLKAIVDNISGNILKTTEEIITGKPESRLKGIKVEVNGEDLAKILKDDLDRVIKEHGKLERRVTKIEKNM